ncbi:MULTISPECIES: HAD family hydrolase [Bacillaceae]|uniref:HAD family hydrolase n=1 Tax=Evansella alkalicola TaxID=745819 RepID=A0ABS6K277_9BACI|nr:MULTISPECIES: HAD family hydrolase [Bacillaceae]MBU9724214.1 HAD family hydrolase [Bacillus alkalicola]
MTWKGVCFDLDNTLFDHEMAFERAIHYCFSSISVRTVSFDEFFSVFKSNCDLYWSWLEKKKLSRREYQRKRFNETMKELGLPFGDELADQFHDLYYQVVAKYCEPYPGLQDLFSFLKKQGVKLGIVSNGKKGTQFGKIAHIGADKWIPEEYIIISGNVGYEKPNIHIFKIAENRLELSSQDFLYIGDSWEHDVVGPIDAGWQAVFLNTRGAKRTTDHSPFAECHELVEVKELLERKYKD